MTSPRSAERLEEVFAAALECPDAERSDFLSRACGEDEELRRDVEELLGAHEGAVGFFDELSDRIVASAPREIESAVRPRLRVGPYRTVEPIGDGGMGAVYRAVRVDGEFEHEVALKLLHLDLQAPRFRSRFLAERQLLARLTHPNIARLLDGGVTDEGRPWFVMELVEGVAIDRWCRERDLSVERRLVLFREVVSAVTYLHRHLVVHRDLKPANILVDTEGRVKLLDFGIAKILADDAGAPGRTATGERLLTPVYAAPEQLAGEPVTTATDVYALGMVLYELLADRRPFDDGKDGPWTRDQLPPPIGAPGGSRGAGDLDAICRKALRPEPEARYASAEQLDHDLERHLEGLPIRARRSTLGYRMGKFARRHRTGLVATVLVVALLAVGWMRERGLRGEAQAARTRAEQETGKAVAVSDFLGELLSSADPARAQGRDVTVAEVLDQAARRLEEGSELEDRPEVESAVRRTLGETYTSLGRYEEAERHLERALELREGLESGTPESLAAAESLAVLDVRVGRHERAEKLLRRVLEERTMGLGAEHPRTLAAQGHLADLLWAQQRYDEVEPLDRRTLEVRRRVLGPDHPDTLRALNALATTLFSGARYPEAAKLFARALEVQRHELGELHPDTLTLANNLAASHLELGRYREAEALLQQVAEGRRRVLGEDHEETALALHNLGATLLQLARWGEAEGVLRRAIAVRQTLPGDGRAVLYSRSHLADLMRERGDLDAAETLYREVLAAQAERYGPEDAETLKTAAGLAELRRRQGRLDQAERRIGTVLEAQQRILGADHPLTLESRIIDARLALDAGEPAEARREMDEALEEGRRPLDEEHPLVLAARFVRARASSALGLREEALEEARAVRAALLEALGEEHPRTRAAAVLEAELRGAPGEGGDLAEKELPR